MIDFLKRTAARHVRPRVSPEVWDRLRSHGDPPRPSLTELAQRTGTDKWGLHCYHNLIVVEKGDNLEGSNKRDVLRKRYPRRPKAGG